MTSASVPTTPSPSYPPSLDELRAEFSALHPSYTWGTAHCQSTTAKLPPTGPLVYPFEEPRSGLGYTPPLRRNEWIHFVNEQAKIMGKEEGVYCHYGFAAASTDGQKQDPFWHLWAMHYSYQQFCSNYAKTKSARLEREEKQSKIVLPQTVGKTCLLISYTSNAFWEAAKRQRLAAAKKAKQEAEKAKQEAENRAKAAAQHALEMAQAKEWAAQKIQEEKVASERLAAQRELAELFAPQPPLPAWHR